MIFPIKENYIIYKLYDEDVPWDVRYIGQTKLSKYERLGQWLYRARIMNHHSVVRHKELLEWMRWVWYRGSSVQIDELFTLEKKDNELERHLVQKLSRLGYRLLNNCYTPRHSYSLKLAWEDDEKRRNMMEFRNYGT